MTDAKASAMAGGNDYLPTNALALASAGGNDSTHASTPLGNRYNYKLINP